MIITLFVFVIFSFASVILLVIFRKYTLHGRTWRTFIFRPPIPKRPVSTATTSTSAHKGKVIAIPRSSDVSGFPTSPPHLYRIRVQTRFQSSVVASTLPNGFDTEGKFVVLFWDSHRCHLAFSLPMVPPFFNQI